MTQFLCINQLLELQHSNFEIVDIQVYEDEILWQIEHKKDAVYVCSSCGEKHSSAHALDWITLQDVPLGNKKAFWKIKRARILCTCSLNPQVEELKFRSPGHRLTQRFVEYIEEILCSKMFTVADVARLFNLNYDVVYKIDHRVLYKLVQTLKIEVPEHISVDEKCFKKQSKYVTIISDAQKGLAIWVSRGNSKESLDEFFKIIGPQDCKKIKTVAKDLHRPYAESVREHIPHAIEIADKFHVVQRLNQALDDCRRELAVESDLRPRRRKDINRLHWVLRYKKENLPQRHLEEISLLKKLNEPLFEAYLLKESFYQFFEFASYELQKAKNFLLQWTLNAFKVGLKGLSDFATYLSRHSEILINIIREKRTSAVSEGINRKITVLKSMAYGYQNIDYFRLKILQRCGVLGALFKPSKNYLYHVIS